MKGRLALISLLAILLTVVTVPMPHAAAASSVILYGSAYHGSSGPATLYTIDITTGVATSVGPIGFHTVGAIDFDATGTLYGTGTRPSGPNTAVLIKIDPATGAGTEVGPLGLGTGNVVQDIAFRPSDNTLFAYAEGDIYTINIATGAATLVGSDTIGFPDGNGIAFSSADILYHADQARVHIINQNTGAATTITPLTYPALGSGEQRINAMKFHPETGLLYGSDVRGLHPPIANYLVTVNIGTGIVTDVGQTVDGLDAIAFTPTTTTPVAVGGTVILVDKLAVLKPWLALVAVLGVFALATLVAHGKKKNQN